MKCMATLRQLLTEREESVLSNNPCIYIDLNKNFKELTIQDLFNISLELIRTEYPFKMPSCILSAEAINILTQRAKDKNIGLFQPSSLRTGG